MGLKRASSGHARRALVAVVASALLAAVMAASAVAAPTPPAGPPASGPGSATGLPWTTYTRVDHTFSNAVDNYSTFVPAGYVGGGSAPSTQHVVVFVHGWLGFDPMYYQTWIDHLVLRGNIVIFPNYQTSALTPPATFTANAMWSVGDALTWLNAHATPKPNTSSGVFLAGHSWGGPVMANYAQRAAAAGLPKAAGIFWANPWHTTIDSSLSGIPSTTKTLCLVGADDTTAGRSGCDTIWDKTSQITQRNYVYMRSDAHGSPGLVADHRAPTNAGDAVVDALDWYAYWKLGDALEDCTFSSTNCNVAFGNTFAQTFMGRWSDGQLVSQLWAYTSKPANPFPDSHPPTS